VIGRRRLHGAALPLYYSTLILASLMTFAHLAASALT
jgi:hypothetical protein